MEDKNNAPKIDSRSQKMTLILPLKIFGGGRRI
jgi:hypothetical protein